MKQKILSFGPVRRSSPSRAKAAASGRRRRRRRTGRQTLNYILLMLVALSIFSVLSLTVFFKIEAVEVSGNAMYADEELIESSGIQIGDNLFRVSVKKVEERLIEKFPYVEEVHFKRVFPAKLVLEITQATPLGAVDTSVGYLIIGRSGRILEANAVSLPEAMTVVTGMYISSPAVGRRLGTVVERGEIIYPEEVQQTNAFDQAEAAEREEEAKRQKISNKERDRIRRQEAAEAEEDGFKMLTYLVDAVEETGFENITLIDFSDPLNMMIVYDGRIMVELGSEAHLALKLQAVEKVALENLADDFEGTLDVTMVGSSTPAEIWSRPGDIQSEIDARRKFIEEAQEEEEPETTIWFQDSSNPELALDPDALAAANSAAAKAAASSSSAASGPPEQASSSSRDELATVPVG